MNIHRIFTIVCIALAALFAADLPMEAAAAKKKATTTQTKKNTKKKTSSSSKKKSTSSKKKSSKSSTSKKNSSKSSTRSSRKKKKKGTSTSKKKTRKKSRTTARRRTTPAPAPDPVSYDSLTLHINRAVVASIPDNVNPGGLRVNHVTLDRPDKIAKIGLNENFTYLPITNEFIRSIQETATRALPDSIDDYRVVLNVGKRNLAYYISRIDKLPEKYRKNTPVVTASDPVWRAKKGMDGDHVALWSSHGRYYKNGGWSWQRPQLFETMEDVFTMSYILPYVAPMLENAGAVVFMPRERDTNREEVIVDFDTNPSGDLFSQTTYKEMNGEQRWQTGEHEGFIYDLKNFRDTENPFEVGTYRQVKTVGKNGRMSAAAWHADIPKDGEYAVYVSYKTLPESTADAHYTVNYSGGSKEFIVNQTMGGSTWIYLGTFPLKEGYDDKVPVVALSNHSTVPGKILTADAVKIGGGMGNIERSPRRSDVYYDPSTPDSSTYREEETESEDEEEIDESDDSETDDEEGDDEATDEESDDEDSGDVDEEDVESDGQPAVDTTDTTQPARPQGYAPTFRTSGLPRYLEGARYWLHWAGFPETVYSPNHGSDDYKDDISSRGNWVNYLAGGSRVLPKRKGLNIPIDISMALHSDAGKRADDSIIGTLGIYYSNDGASYPDGTPRSNSRMLTDMLLRQITQDAKRTYEPAWTRRSMWDKSYAEARMQEVPSSLIEIMSHQNFGDMQYGLDPNFRFTMGRAMYKAMARFVAERKDREVVIQPLPVKDFSIVPLKKSGHYRLSWAPTEDPLEPTATPTHYIVMERNEGDLGFHVLKEVKGTNLEVTVKNDMIHSYRILAANDGGVSFPSETLSLRYAKGNKPTVLVVNGFTRVSAPGHFSEDGRAGFDSETDFGVPYIKDISFIGHQTEFRRGAGEGFGRSASNYVDKVIAGNTFDYPALHGESIANADYGFVSASLGAVEKGDVKLTDYKIVDLILGKQKATTIGKGSSGVKFRAFPKELQNQVKKYLEKGGKLFLSGQYVASDLTQGIASEADRRFAHDVLGIESIGHSSRTRSGRVTTIPTDMKTPFQQRTYNYSNTLNEQQYIVENPDAIIPADGTSGQVFLEFTDTSAPAGVLNNSGGGKSVIMSIPFESVSDPNLRDNLMAEILKFLSL